MKKSKGATIIEIIVYTFLSVTLILVLTDIFTSLLDKSSESISLSEAETDGKFISQKIFNDLSRADSVSIPAAVGASNNFLSFSIDSVNRTYSLSGQNMLLDDGISSERLNGYGTQVSAFEATRLGNPGGKPVLKISFTLNSTFMRPSGYETKNYDLTVGVRN